MRTRWSLLLVALLMSLIPVETQTVDVLTMNWNIPQNLCSTATECGAYYEVGLDNTLYIFDGYNDDFYVIRPDGSLPIQIDTSIVGKLFDSFVVLNDRQIFFQRWSGKGGISLFLLDIPTQMISMYDINGLGFVMPCHYYPINMGQAVYRFDDEHLLACSQYASGNPNYPQSYNIHLINVAQKAIAQTITFNYQLERSTYGAWAELRVGLNKSIYILGIRESIREISFENATGTTTWTIPNTVSTVKNVRFDTQTSLFSSFDQFAQIPSRYTIAPSINPVGVDENGNQYVLLYGGLTTNPMSDLYKISPSGDIIWQLSNPTIPTNPSYASLLAENRIFIKGANNYFSFLNITDPTPTATATNTPVSGATATKTP